MTGKIFRYAFLAGILSVLFCAALFFSLQYRQNLDEAYATLRQETEYVARGIALDGEAYLLDLPSDRRITWIDADGEVLYDSQTAGLPNQGSLQEVRSALETGSGQATRTSGSHGVSAMYYASRLADGTVVRLSLPVSAVRSALIAVSPVLWVIVLVLTISGILAFRAAKQIVRPINEIDPDHPEQSRVYPELDPLMQRLREQRLTIDEQLEELHQRQREFSALTDNMQEGFLLLDREGAILTANASAKLHLGEAEPGSKLLEEGNKAARESARKALNGQRDELVFSENERTWQLVASPVFSHERIVGAVLLWMDVTEREQRERLRQEFSANISHELKTPLTSISGFAELMAQGTVPSDKVAEFSADIHREAQRLIALVEDIMKLSKLDENAVQPDWEDVDLYALTEDVCDILQAVAEKGEIRLRLEGDHCCTHGIWKLLHEMVYNLCDNAIKYNRPGGSVTVRIGRQDERIRLSVEDTGIGIPPADQSRVFERFYRVDKSHSKQIGGTGLGLSIVKHGAQYHNAGLTLNSKPGEGTTVTLLFIPAEPEPHTEGPGQAGG